jgi:membrane protease YdiL (CAAX protease family)
MEDDLLPPSDDDGPHRDVTVIFAVFFEVALALFSLILGWLLGRNPLETFRWSLIAVGWGVAATIPLILLSWAMLRWPIGALGAFKEFCEKEVAPRLEDATWSDLALISVAVGVADEMLCRGVMQASLSNRFGVPGGLGLASMVVGILQPISFPYMIMAGLLGLYLGTIWILSGNLLTPMVTHAIYEFVALAYMVRIRPPSGVV